MASRFARAGGLSPALVEDVTLAGELHDWGKADPRFQALLYGGNIWAARAAGTLFAKSGTLPTGFSSLRRAYQQSGYPRGGRHELLSVRLIEGAPAALQRAHDPELVLHLVASHHGRCRPFAPVVRDEKPVTVEATILDQAVEAVSRTNLERLDSGVPDRFWRLVRCYGWWGLAFLEAVLRLADHRQSEQEIEDTPAAAAPAEVVR